MFTYRQVPFVAMPLQFGVTGALIVALWMAALKLPRPDSARTKAAPHPIVLFLASFVAGSLFMIASRRAESAWHLGWVAAVSLALVTVALYLAFVVASTRTGRWDESRRFALMAGAFMVYAWIGFETDMSLHGTEDLVGHSVLAAVLCALLIVVGWRATRGSNAGT